MRDNFYKKEETIFVILFESIIVGTIAGLFSVLYRFIVSKMGIIRGNLYGSVNLKNILIILALAVVISWTINYLLKIAPLSGGSGIPQIRGEILGKFDMNSEKVLLSKILGGSLGNLMGFSLGREGPSIQMGGASAKIIGRLMKRPPDEVKYMITAGAAAGLAAAFNAPMAGCIFAMEELHKSFSKFVLLPALIASIIANYISFVLMGYDTSFSFAVKETMPIKFMWVAVIVGLVTGIVGVFFNKLIVMFQDFFKKFNSKVLKYSVLMGVAILVGYSFVEMTGGGHGLLEDMAKSEFPLKYILLIIVIKLLFTTFCYGSGVQGGIFLPVLVIGGASGALVYSLMHGVDGLQNYYVNFIILGMSGILASVVRSPILSIILVSEMTSTFEHLIGLSVVVVVSYYVAEALRVDPIYETLFERQLKDKNLLETPERDLSDYSVFEYGVNAGSNIIGKTLAEINFPRHLIIISIERDNYEFVPVAGDEIRAGDKLLVLAKAEYFLEIDKFFSRELEKA
ncbi:ClC family H(+)/Cl(-) exchange transporter [Peptoniphilus sp.]|jgi:H+/Cl- antiporter ClcA|uniref:ClC family H(+)/Cl(-) exchange transporter n=1 Tax=Peptoniphilus sp. TaxID=1971214 RepID=UPI003D91B11B